MPLHTDYRPTSFAEVKGNQSTIASLKAIFDRESDWPHAILLQGPKGCGKTTLARIIAGILDCKGGDFVEINSSNDRGINTARNIMDGARFRPMSGKARVYLLDEVHSCTGDFQRAMLKPLEDAPKHAYFILCTTDPQQLIAPLKSRCTTFEVSPLKDSEIVELLQEVLEKEKVDWVPVDILKKIALAVDGCPRDALKILDQIIDMEESEMEGAIASFSYSEKQVVDLCKSLLNKQSWDKIRLILKQIDLSNPEQARRGMIGLMASNVMKKDDPLSALIFDCYKDPFYNTGKAGFQMATYRAWTEISMMD